MNESGKRVVLLARPGAACNWLRGALADAGAQVVLEADPLTLDPAALEAAQPQVVMVALDTQTEEALDRFEMALQDPAIEVIFDEAELAAKREGWEAARWVRHLAAKLQRHDQVLPPGGESAGTSDNAGMSAAQPAGEPLPEVAHKGAAQQAGTSAVNESHPFDPLLAEFAFDQHATVAAGQGAFTGADPAAAPRLSPSFDPDLDFSYDGNFDPVVATAPGDASPASTVDPFNFALDTDAPPDGLGELRGEPRTGGRAPGFDQMFDGDFAAVAGSGGDAPASAGQAFDDATADPADGASKHVLELLSDDELAPALRGYAEPSAEGVGADHRFKRDLASLESRIAGMELVKDRIVKGPAQANGAVLVMAGIGGPDAVRQLLGALPADFPRPVFVQQRLDGGRYDKLVAQMQRATALTVKLAEPGLPAIPGVVYILPAGIGIKLEDIGIQFTSGGDDVMASLPSADSAVLLLSGSDPAQVDAVMNHSWAGALVIGQAPDGCYDAAAPSALAARGGDCGPPAELARRLAERWRP